MTIPTTNTTTYSITDADLYADTAYNEAQEAEIRRQMYERIAQGNALAEAEDQANDWWSHL